MNSEDVNKTKFKKWTVSYLNKKEYHLLKEEIFREEIYSCNEPEIKISVENPLILDVGAHIGLTTIYFKEQFPNSQIVAVEPNPINLELLEVNIFENGISDVEILPCAVDQSSQEAAQFHVNSAEKWHSTGSLRSGGWNRGQLMTPIEVETVKFSQLVNVVLEKYERNKIDLVKLDVEGSELDILMQSKSVLDKIGNFIIEYHPARNALKGIESVLLQKHFNISYWIDGKPSKRTDDKLMIIKAVKRN